MRYLLDSHVFLWFDDPAQLTVAVRAILDDAENELFLSVASLWELTLKRAAGKLHFTGAFADVALSYRIALLPVEAMHVEAVEDLPRYHKDPFDHLLVAQARVENLVLVTRDAMLARYPVPIMRV